MNSTSTHLNNDSENINVKCEKAQTINPHHQCESKQNSFSPPTLLPTQLPFNQHMIECDLHRNLDILSHQIQLMYEPQCIGFAISYLYQMGEQCQCTCFWSSE